MKRIFGYLVLTFTIFAGLASMSFAYQSGRNGVFTNQYNNVCSYSNGHNSRIYNGYIDDNILTNQEFQKLTNYNSTYNCGGYLHNGKY